MKTEIVAQKDREEAITAYLLGVWVTSRLEIMQMQPSLVPTASVEELGLLRRLMRQYGTTTPSEFAECIRLAAIDKQRDLSQGLARFPTLYEADIGEKIQKLTLEKLKKADQTPQLPQNTGGNAFCGEPSEALAREWPKIMEQTKIVRGTIHPGMRDRFWYGGSLEQRQSAVAMLRQMVFEMNEVGKWDLRQNQWEALVIFQHEFCQSFPTFGAMIEGMKCPICPIQVAEIKSKLSRIALSTADFPDIDDCKYSSVFDAYWKFTEAKTAEIV